MLQSKVADDVIWEKFTRPRANCPYATALANVTFEVKDTPDPLGSFLSRASKESKLDASNRLLIVVGRSRRMDVENVHKELNIILEKNNATGIGGEFRKTVGDPATAVVLSALSADLLVVQAAKVSIKEA